MLIKVANKDTEGVVTALIKHAQKLPGELYQSLTWDRGKELADHQRLTLATDIEVYFCDLRSPWQCGSNENTNRPMRQYLPRAPTCPCTARPSLVPSRGNSTNVPEGPCSSKPQRRSSLSVLQPSVEPAASSGHSPLFWRRSISRSIAWRLFRVSFRSNELCELCGVVSCNSTRRNCRASSSFDSSSSYPSDGTPLRL